PREGHVVTGRRGELGLERGPALLQVAYQGVGAPELVPERARAPPRPPSAGRTGRTGRTSCTARAATSGLPAAPRAGVITRALPGRDRARLPAGHGRHAGHRLRPPPGTGRPPLGLVRGIATRHALGPPVAVEHD